MRKTILLLVLTLTSGLCVAQTNYQFPSQTVTASAQTTPPLQLYGTKFPSSFSVGTVNLTGTALTTVTFAVMGSSDGGVTYYALPITTVASPGSTPTLTVTATVNGLYQVNLVGITNLQFVTSGTFTATNVSLILTASPNGSLSKSTTLGPGALAAANSWSALQTFLAGINITGTYNRQQVFGLWLFCWSNYRGSHCGNLYIRHYRHLHSGYHYGSIRDGHY